MSNISPKMYNTLQSSFSNSISQATLKILVWKVEIEMLKIQPSKWLHGKTGGRWHYVSTPSVTTSRETAIKEPIKGLIRHKYNVCQRGERWGGGREKVFFFYLCFTPSCFLVLICAFNWWDWVDQPSANWVGGRVLQICWVPTHGMLQPTKYLYGKCR